jgi:hypothetical protein
MWTHFPKHLEVWVGGPLFKGQTPWEHAIGVLEFLSWFKLDLFPHMAKLSTLFINK